MKRKQCAWSIDPELKDRFNAEVRAEHLKPSQQLEEILKLYLDYMLPKMRQGK